MATRRTLLASLAAATLLGSSALAGAQQLLANPTLVDMVAQHGDGQRPDNAEARQNDGKRPDNAEARQNDGKRPDNAEARHGDGQQPDNADF